ncbi:MAG TPA: hypothetical protein PLM82_12765 [Candidatus Latescibacteria bacterium]|jgi:hypothetical protein|nr:hypothetical protein [Candidatus Latescibacterota bacterium]
MRHATHNAGFSLMEVNMAVFVMAVGILSMVALFPLGLREGVQARSDLKQAMFADHALNQIVAVLSQTNMTWSVWKKLDGFEGDATKLQGKLSSGIMPRRLSGGAVDLGKTLPENWTIGADGTTLKNQHFHIACFIPDDTPSGRILGVTVRSTDTDDPYPTTERERRAWETRYPPYYAEVLFNGDPTQ